MRKYLKHITLFLIPILICAVALETFTRNIPNSYKLKKEYLKNNSNEIEVLALIYWGVLICFMG